MVSSLFVEPIRFSRDESGHASSAKTNRRRWHGVGILKTGRPVSLLPAPGDLTTTVRWITIRSPGVRPNRVSIGAASDRTSYRADTWDSVSQERSKKWFQNLVNDDDTVATHFADAFKIWEPPKFLWRTLYTFLLLGMVVKRVVWHRQLNMQQTLQQVARVGPDTLGVAMLTSSFVGMVFTIQFCKEFSKVGLTRVIGGLLGLAFTRELTPVICAIVLAGRVGSSIAAELGTMQVSEQVDQLRTLGSDPVDYLVAPRVVACAVSLPILSVFSFTIGMAASILLADLRYGISPNAVIDSAAKYLEPSDVGVMCAKGLAFGGVIAVISCGWGQTTTGGAKGVGESTTASVVISLVAIFVVDFFLSMIFFNK
tara:strand:+ start:335 stop:1441 length:1107 start_codon:yes stop_codon:yes gene_type:complete